jgi:hypothetical protein
MTPSRDLKNIKKEKRKREKEKEKSRPFLYVNRPFGTGKILDRTLFGTRMSLYSYSY